MISTTRRALDRALDLLLMQIWLLIIPAMMLMPASIWYSIERFIVTDSYDAQGHRIIELTRHINFDFYGTWRVEEQMKNADGRFVTVETCHGNSRYRADKSPPDVPTLDWWKGDDCEMLRPYVELPAGTWRICTFITIQPRFFPQKQVDFCSPEFMR